MERFSRFTSAPLTLACRNLRCVCALLFLCASQPGELRGATVAAGVTIVYEEAAQKIIKVADFPDTDAFRGKDGGLVDAGYLFKQFRIFWIPIWNYGGRWCGYSQDGSGYYNVDKATLEIMAKQARVSLPDEPELPFWDAYGGKLLAGALLVLVIASYTGGGERDEAPARKAAPSPAAMATAPARPAAPAAPAAPRVVYVARNGENLGQLTAIDIKKQLADGALDLDDHYFDPPRNEWVPLRDMRWLG